jgi:hypothetical protein
MAAHAYWPAFYLLIRLLGGWHLHTIVLGFSVFWGRREAVKHTIMHARLTSSVCLLLFCTAAAAASCRVSP